MTYWDMDHYEVEDLMTEFLKKSLAQSEFDPKLDSYVYSIHDLQLDYLKSKLKNDAGKERVKYYFTYFTAIHVDCLAKDIPF